MPGTRKPRLLLSLEQARWRRAGQDLRRRLGEFADQPSLAWDAARAQDIYLGCMGEQTVDGDDDFTMERCFEWFIFDYKLSSGKTVIETFREERSQTLSEFEAVLLKDWARSRISLYEIKKVIPGEGVVIKELLGRGEKLVRDSNAAAEVEPGSILLIRVLKVGNEYEFSTGGLALPGECRKPLLDRLYQDRQEYFSEIKRKVHGWSNYLKERAHKINAMVVEYGLNNSRSGAAAPAGEETVRWTVLYVGSWQDVLKAIGKSDSFRIIRELKDGSGSLRQVTAALLGGEYRGRNMRPVLGHLTLTQRFIIITAGSPRLLAECKKLLMGLLTEMVKENPDGKNCTWIFL